MLMRGDERAGRAAGRTRISPQPLVLGKILPGFSRPAGLNASRTRRINVEIVFAEQKRHQVIFFHAHAVLAGDGAAHVDAEANNFVGGGDGAAKLLFVAARRTESADADCRRPREKYCRSRNRISLPISLMRRSVCGSLVRGITPSWT